MKARIELTPQIVSRVDDAFSVDAECEGFLHCHLERVISSSELMRSRFIRMLG